MAPKSIVLLSDSKIATVSVREAAEPLVDLRKYNWLAVDQRRARTSPSFSLVRRSVAKRIKIASHSLPEGVRYLIVEGHRPRALQRRYFSRYCRYLTRSHPEWKEDRILAEASKFVASPRGIPPHSTGGAVDLTLIDDRGNELDMGTPMNADPILTRNACFTRAGNISREAKRNRSYLISSLLKAGLVNYPTEWWHWSFGDQYWAYQTSARAAVFGSVELKHKDEQKLRLKTKEKRSG